MILDFHTHNFPVALAPRAVGLMTAQMQGRLAPYGDGTLARQLADMDEAGVDKAVLAPVSTAPTQYATILRRSLAIRDGEEGEEAARRIVPLAGIHPADREYAAHLREIAATGIRGVVFHPYFQHIRLDDPRVFPIFAAVRDAGLFAMCHCGGDTGYPDSPMCCGPVEIEALLEGVPGLTFVACHLGGLNGTSADLVRRLHRFPTCYIDTAVLTEDTDTEGAARVLTEFPVDRILFGTDYFWRDERDVLAFVRRVRTDPADREKIFSLNAARLLG